MQVLHSLARRYKQALSSRKTLRLLIFAYASFFAIWTTCEFGSLLDSCLKKDLSIVHFKQTVGLSDFIHFYIAGQIAASPDRTSSFTWQGQKVFFDKLIGYKLPFDFHTQHSPLIFLIMIPFSRLPLDQSHLAWEFMTTVIGALGLFAIASELGYLKKPITLVIIFGIFACESAWQNWSQGHFMWLYLGLSCFYLASVFRNRNILIGGFSLALLVIKPQYLLFLLTPALALRRYSLLATALIADLVLGIVCVKIFSLESLLDYPHQLHQCELTSSRIFTESMNCIRSTVYLFFPQTTAYSMAWTLYLVSLTATCVALFYILKNRKGEKDIFIWSISSTVLMSLLFSPHAHKQDLLMLAIPAILLLPSLNEEPQSRSIKLIRTIFYTMPPLSWFLFFLGNPFLPWEIGNHIWVLLFITLLIAFIIQLMSHIRRTAPASSFEKSDVPNQC